MGENCDMFLFVNWGIVGGALCIFGFCGNVLSFLAFQKDKRSSTTTLLQSLAVSDFLLLAWVFITDSVPYICDYIEGCVNPWDSWPYIRYIWILTPIAHMCSIWLVVLIALNRYWAVCHAMELARVWNNTRTPIYVATVVGCVIAFNLPRFFEYKMVTGVVTVTTENGGAHSNQTQASIATNTTNITTSITKEIIREEPTEFGSTFTYRYLYKMGLVSVVLIIVPLVLLIALTITILVVLQNTRKRVQQRQTTSSPRATNNTDDSNGASQTTPKTQKRQKAPKSPKSKASQEITFILILVVVVAIICQSPLAVFHFIRYTGYKGCGHMVFYLDNISKLLVNVNSSINFIIYCLFSPKFRKLLISSLKCMCCKDQISNTLNEFTTNWGIRTNTVKSKVTKLNSNKGDEVVVAPEKQADELTSNQSSNDVVHINKVGSRVSFRNTHDSITPQNGVQSISANNQNGQQNGGGGCHGNSAETDDVIIVNVLVRDVDDVSNQNGENAKTENTDEYKASGTANNAVVSTGIDNQSMNDAQKSNKSRSDSHGTEASKSNENNCYQISAENKNLNNAAASYNLQSHNRQSSSEETKPCLSFCNADAQLQYETQNTDNNSSLIPSLLPENNKLENRETLQTPYSGGASNSNDGKPDNQRSATSVATSGSHCLNNEKPRHKLDKQCSATPVTPSSNAATKDDGANTFVLSNADVGTTYVNQYGDDEDYDTPETPMLPKDFHSLLIPMRETVC